MKGLETIISSFQPISADTYERKALPSQNTHNIFILSTKKLSFYNIIHYKKFHFASPSKNQLSLSEIPR